MWPCFMFLSAYAEIDKENIAAQFENYLQIVTAVLSMT